MNMTMGGSGVLGWIVIALGAVATVATICVAIYWLVRPGENEPDHPKRIILKEDR